MARTPEPSALRVAVIDDHLLVREGLVASLVDMGFEVTFTGSDPAGLLASGAPVDVVLLDLDLGDGREASVADTEEMIARGWHVLVVSAMALPDRVRAFLKTEVSGFVPKSEPLAALADAIRSAASGAGMTSRELAGIIVGDDDPKRPALSDQELRALQLYASGLKMAAVAHRMNVSANTAKEYIARVRAKYAALGRPAPTKTELYRQALRDHLLDE